MEWSNWTSGHTIIPDGETIAVVAAALGKTPRTIWIWIAAGLPVIQKMAVACGAETDASDRQAAGEGGSAGTGALSRQAKEERHEVAAAFQLFQWMAA
jgi:hypothetical protein